MSRHVPTAFDVFSESDPERPVASLRRIGGGTWELITGAVPHPQFDTLEEAQAAADQIAEQADRKLPKRRKR